MKYSLNDYLPYIEDKTSRVLLYPDKEFAAKLVSEYKMSRAIVKPLYELLPEGTTVILSPQNVIAQIKSFVEYSTEINVIVGVEAYLVFLTTDEIKDFFIGIRNFLEIDKFIIHILVSRNFESYLGMSNPKYEGAMNLVRFKGNHGENSEISIKLISERWGKHNIHGTMLLDAMHKLGDYYPTGDYCFSMNEENLPSGNFRCITVINTAKDAMKVLYKLDLPFNEEQIETLLSECNTENKKPIELILSRLGESTCLSCTEAPVKLHDLENDSLWSIYVWFIKGKIQKDTYLYTVLDNEDLTAPAFLEEYIVQSAIRCMKNGKEKAYANERASVIRNIKAVEPLIAQFVSKTEHDCKSIPFLNCGTDAEAQGLIRRAAAYDLSIHLPDVFDDADPLINYYLAPNFDYGVERLSKYFNRLRQLRLKNSIDKDFVKEAYYAEVPKDVERRDAIIGKYNDGETALLVVDGLGAEYLPLLVNIAVRNNLYIEKKAVVSVNLPTSTEFNHIKWDSEHRLQEVKQADNISHMGHSKFEKCSYEENLAEVMRVFRQTILTRVIEGLHAYKRVLVTGDHGSSYLAINAYNKELVKTIEWENPDDWRYTAIGKNQDAPKEIEIVYRPEKGCYYYVVKGYNRFSKRGGKAYAVHGGATLEERLVPFVLFSSNPTTAIEQDIVEEQLIENSDFDIL